MSRTKSAASFAIALSVLLTAACTKQAAVEDAVRKSLRDPESGKFSQVSTSKDGTVGCGFVNAKNGFGGYTGDQFFMYYQGSVRTFPDEKLDYLPIDCCYAAKRRADGFVADDDEAKRQEWSCGYLTPPIQLAPVAPKAP